MYPPVTWLLPVKNSGRYLTDTLRSIEEQTVREWEVLAWDNGSTDGTVGILSSWIPERLPGRIVTDRPHRELGSCLREMVLESRTELLARIDADDLCEPDRLERQLSEMRSHPDLAVLASRAIIIDGRGHETGRTQNVLEPAEIHWRLFFANPIPHPSVLMRRQDILDAGNYRRMGMGQDFDLWCRVVPRFRIACLEKPLIRYRVHPYSVSGSSEHAWPCLAHDLAQRYWRMLFPGVAREQCMEVWRFLSPFSSTRLAGAQVESSVVAMLRAIAVAHGRSVGQLMSMPSIAADIRESSLNLCYRTAREVWQATKFTR